MKSATTLAESNRFKRPSEEGNGSGLMNDSEEFENIENQINSQIGKVTTNIGTGLSNLTNLRGSFSGRSR
jgi:hypothetical protein